MSAKVEPETLETAYLYDGTLEGLFTAIFTAYELHEQPLDIACADAVQLRLGQEARSIATDLEKSDRVARGILQAGGRATFEAVRKASVSSQPDAGTAIYHFVRKLMKERRYLLNDLADPVCGRLFELNRAVDNECEKMRQFVRFSHLKNGGWFAVCNPQNSVIPLIMGYFVSRFNDQSFAIYDEVHHLAGVYGGKSWYLVHTDSFQPPVYSSEEDLMQTAWRRFYQVLSIDARYNPELRRQHMPVRYWKNLTEMQQTITSLPSKEGVL